MEDGKLLTEPRDKAQVLSRQYDSVCTIEVDVSISVLDNWKTRMQKIAVDQVY